MGNNRVLREELRVKLAAVLRINSDQVSEINSYVNTINDEDFLNLKIFLENIEQFRNRSNPV